MLIWRVNVATQTLRREPAPATYERLGGRGLLAQILVDEIDATCDPLGPANKLIFAPGLLVGHMLSSCDRISVGGKSPLTGGVKESNAGGRTGLQLTHLGIKALILEGEPAAPGLWVLRIDADGAQFEPAGDLVGLGVYETGRLLYERFGPKVAVALIGPGGEMRLSAAGIQNADKERVPSRINARGGLGALMAAKGLKAIVIDASGGAKPPIADPAAFRAAAEGLQPGAHGRAADQELRGLRYRGHGRHVQRLRRPAHAQLFRGPVRGGRGDQRRRLARPVVASRG